MISCLLTFWKSYFTILCIIYTVCCTHYKLAKMDINRVSLELYLCIYIIIYGLISMRVKSLMMLT